MRSIASLRALMAMLKIRVWELFDAGVDSVKPLFYYFEDEITGKPDWKCAIDLGVFTKKRNFRLPNCTKCTKNAFLHNTNDKVPQWNREGKSPCAVKISDQVLLLSTGFILGRNSIGFWNPITIRYTPLLSSISNRSEASNQMVSKPNDFRCLPDTGSVIAHCSRLHKEYDRGVSWPEGMKNEDIILLIDTLLDSFLRNYYDESWIELIRPFSADLSTPFGDCIKKLYATCKQSPRHLVTYVLCWAQLYRPGLGLNQKASAGKGFVLQLAHLYTNLIMTAVSRADPIASFNAVFGLFSKNEQTLSETCSASMAPLKRDFLNNLAKTFIDNYVSTYVLPNAYNTQHLLDVFVLFHMCRNLLLCTGFHVLSMERDSDNNSWILPNTLPVGDKSLIRIFEYCFKTSLKHECKHEAPKRSAINTLRISENESIALNVYAKSQYKEDLLEGLIPRLRKKFRLDEHNNRPEEEEEDDDEEHKSGNEPFRIVRVHFRLPEQGTVE